MHTTWVEPGRLDLNGRTIRIGKAAKTKNQATAKVRLAKTSYSSSLWFTYLSAVSQLRRASTSRLEGWSSSKSAKRKRRMPVENSGQKESKAHREDPVAGWLRTQRLYSDEEDVEEFSAALIGLR